MTTCDYCGKKVDVPFECKFCGGTFCSDHRLPEAHECAGLEEYKKKAGEKKKVIYEPFRPERSKDTSPSIFQRFSSFLGLLSSNYYMLIIFLCVAVFFLQIIFGGGNPICLNVANGECAQPNPFTAFFWMLPTAFFKKPWTFLTSVFLHGGFWHLFVNMLVLFFFGGELERRVGSRKFLEIFMISGIAGNLGFVLLSLVMNSPVPAVGASGAVFGVFAALAIIAPEIRVLLWFVIPLKIRHALVLFALWNLFLLPYGGPVANSAHLSGLLIGLVYGYTLKKKSNPLGNNWL